MPYKEFQENWNTFLKLLEQLPDAKDEQVKTLIKRYTEQNLMILNDVFAISIDNFKKLQTAQTAEDIIRIQVSLTNDISKKLSLSAQRFLNASLGNISHYNEWLKGCDFATD